MRGDGGTSAWELDELSLSVLLLELLPLLAEKLFSSRCRFRDSPT